MATKEWKEQQDALIESVTGRPTLLLHACCAPCSSSVLELLTKYFTVSVYFYNPNIYPQAEYYRRHDELAKFLEKVYPNIALIDRDNFYDYNDVAHEYDEAVDIKHNAYLEKEREKGKRCRICYKLRLEETFQYAAEHNFDWVATTLTVSPRKDATAINEIGLELEKSFSVEDEKTVKYLVSDFKKADGYLRSVQLSKKYGLYRQEYCGCVYSKR